MMWYNSRLNANRYNLIFENLLRGSQNHLRAFTGQIENRVILVFSPEFYNPGIMVLW